MTFPLIAPAILSGTLLSFVVMLGIYGMPAVLGAPANIIGAHHLHLQAHRLEPAALQHRRRGRDHADDRDRRSWSGRSRSVLAGKSFATVAGKAFRPRSLDLGPWRWFTFGLALLYLFIVVVLPTLALVIAAFRRFLFIKDFDALFDVQGHTAWCHFQRCSTIRSPCCRSGTR